MTDHPQPTKPTNFRLHTFFPIPNEHISATTISYLNNAKMNYFNRDLEGCFKDILHNEPVEMFKQSFIPY